MFNIKALQHQQGIGQF